MRLIGEFFQLLYFRIYVFFFQLREEREVRRCFYTDPSFRQQDLAFLKTKNPYKEKKAYPYGETPLTVGQQMADRFGLCKEDRFVDLGCGRGRLTAFLAFYKGCFALGVDWAESFIVQAQQLMRDFPRVKFSCADFREIDLSCATFVYLYGTCLKEKDLGAVLERLSRLKEGAKVVSVSEPLDHPSFFLADQMEVSFPWGRGELFLNIKK